MRTPGWLMRLASAGLLALAVAGCTVDDEIIEGKPCNIVVGDIDCIPGYKCICQTGDRCRCRDQELTGSGDFPLWEGSPAISPSTEASLRLLRQQRAIAPRPSSR